MKLSEANDIEAEIISNLRQFAKEGDNSAAAVLLQHIRGIKQDISAWQDKQGAKKTDSVSNTSNIHPAAAEALAERKARQPKLDEEGPF